MVKGITVREHANQWSKDLSFVSDSARKLCLLLQLYVKQGKYITSLTEVLRESNE